MCKHTIVNMSCISQSNYESTFPRYQLFPKCKDVLSPKHIPRQGSVLYDAMYRAYSTEVSICDRWTDTGLQQIPH